MWQVVAGHGASSHPDEAKKRRIMFRGFFTWGYRCSCMTWWIKRVEQARTDPPGTPAFQVAIEHRSSEVLAHPHVSSLCTANGRFRRFSATPLWRLFQARISFLETDKKDSSRIRSKTINVSQRIPTFRLMNRGPVPK
jgi:hypothetical protein